jgi:hypothetical protein
MANDKYFRYLAVAICVFMSLSIAACSVQEKHDGENKKVEINTPLGAIKVNTGVEPKDVGIKLYPGATPRQASGDDKHSANVQIGNDHFGLKVVAAEYDSNDAPDKILEFYRKELRSYGKVLECKNVGDKKELDSFNDESKELTCEGSGNGNSTELKAGTPDRQRIVAVHPNGNGSRFALVYIQKRERDNNI